MKEEWEQGAYEEPGNEQLASLVEANVMNKIRKETPVRRLPFIRRFRFAAAAILFFIIAGFAWFLIPRVGDKEEEIAITKPTEDLLPGKDGAILTLANGARIVLDTSRNGLVATQGKTNLVKLSDGQLVYQSGANNEEVFYNTLTTPKGRQFNVTLPDGSKVWLNAASSLRYPTSFNGKQRKVEISGEAYFEVAPDKNKAFLVAVNGMEVEVLGTHFNIMAYTDEESIKTSLLEGSVRVRSSSANAKENANELLLSPGQQSAYTTAGQLNLVKNADMEEAIAWKNGLFKFKDADLRFVLRQAARWYDIEIVEGNAMPAERYRGTIARDVKLSEFLKILELNKVRFVLEGRRLVINP
jgi:ferric-dicitrate binding protein FerR (iron transport regulator)